MVVRMTPREIQLERARIKDAKAEALAAEPTAVYNPAEIRKLEARTDRLEGCVADDRIGDEAMVMASQTSSMRISLVVDRCDRLGEALADARRDHADLVGLVERMGRDLHTYWYGEGRCPSANYTLTGQREYDAATHDAEGAPPDAGMLEAVQ